MASLKGQLEVEHQRAEDASRAFYESEDYVNLESTNINIRREGVFYTVWRKYPDLDFSFLGEGVLDVIEGFKTKLTMRQLLSQRCLTMRLTNQARQSRKPWTRTKIGSSRWTALRGCFWPTCGHLVFFIFLSLVVFRQ